MQQAPIDLEKDLQSFTLFADLGKEELRTLRKMVQLVFYAKRVRIFHPGHPGQTVFLLKEGRVKISRLSEQGKEATVRIVEPRDIFGEVEALEGRTRETLAQTLEPVYVYEIRRENFEDFLNRFPEVRVQLLRLLGERLRYVETKLSDFVFRSAPARLAKLLLELGEKTGEVDSSGLRLTVRLTHQNLANLIGASRETVSAVLSQFQDQGLVSQDQRHIYLLNQSRLAEIK